MRERPIFQPLFSTDRSPHLSFSSWNDVPCDFLRGRETGRLWQVWKNNHSRSPYDPSLLHFSHFRVPSDYLSLPLHISLLTLGRTSRSGMHLSLDNRQSKSFQEKTFINLSHLNSRIIQCVWSLDTTRRRWWSLDSYLALRLFWQRYHTFSTYSEHSLLELIFQSFPSFPFRLSPGNSIKHKTGNQSSRLSLDEGSILLPNVIAPSNCNELFSSKNI